MRTSRRRASGTALTLRSLFVVLILCSLAAGVVGGLLRAGVALFAASDAPWAGRAVIDHAFLMMGGFLGTVIGIERAVAVRSRSAFLAPAASGLAGVLILLGLPQPAAALAVVAALAFIAVSVVIWQRQRSAHTAVLLAGATAWLVGNLLFALGARPATIVPWWFCFLVFTIAAERLEMTRLMRRHRAAAPALFALLLALLVGAAAFSLSPAAGGWLFGCTLLGLASWLFACDVARRTVRTHGLSRYMAVCLLLGYAWLAVAGIAWMATAAGFAARDMALHALGLGFIFSMILGHAPVIVPAVARVKLLFGWPFYAVLALLHASLALRLLWGAFDSGAMSLGAAGNALAILLFFMTIATAAIAFHLRCRRQLAAATDARMEYRH